MGPSWNRGENDLVAGFDARPAAYAPITGSIFKSTWSKMFHRRIYHVLICDKVRSKK